MKLLDEMAKVDVQPSIPIFNLLFNNFTQPYVGGSSGGTADDLNRLWARFQEVVTQDPKHALQHKAMDDRLALTIIEAFARRVSKEAASDVWEMISKQWYPTDDTIIKVGEILQKTLQVASRKTLKDEITLSFR
jgi:hypothetical protein